MKRAIIIILCAAVVVVCSIYISSLDKTHDQNIKIDDKHNELWHSTTTEQGISFSYPKELLTKYISKVVWPPQVQILNMPFSCENAGSEIKPVGQTTERLVDNRVYCLTKKSEGAAGSVYTEYIYNFYKDNIALSVDFTLRFVQCQNYDELQASECNSERESFDIDGLIDRLAQTISVDQLSIDKLSDFFDYKNISYSIEGQTVKLNNGLAEYFLSDDSATKILTKYFGNEVSGDLNEDGQDDVAFILTQDSGGSGIFYYVAAALKGDIGYGGTNAIFLGDRISPQSSEIRDGTIIINYADRQTGEAMTAVPSVGVSKYFIVENNILTPVDIK